MITPVSNILIPARFLLTICHILMFSMVLHAKVSHIAIYPPPPPSANCFRRTTSRRPYPWTTLRTSMTATITSELGSILMSTSLEIHFCRIEILSLLMHIIYLVLNDKKSVIGLPLIEQDHNGAGTVSDLSFHWNVGADGWVLPLQQLQQHIM